MDGEKQCGCSCCMERRLRDKKWEAMKEPVRDEHPGSVDYMGGCVDIIDEPECEPVEKLRLNSMYGKWNNKTAAEDVPHVEWADYAALREKYHETVVQLDELRQAMRIVCRTL